MYTVGGPAVGHIMVAREKHVLTGLVHPPTRDRDDAAIEGDGGVWRNLACMRRWWLGDGVW